jgi:DUF971 family protein
MVYNLCPFLLSGSILLFAAKKFFQFHPVVWTLNTLLCLFNLKIMIMAGLSKETPLPTDIRLHQKSRVLEVCFTNDQVFHLSCEYLRVYSPSAAVRGHSPEQAILQTGKQEVTITAIEPVGQYAVKLIFSDGHDSGLYSWDYLYELGKYQVAYWQNYLMRLHQAGLSREDKTHEKING